MRHLHQVGRAARELTATPASSPLLAPCPSLADNHPPRIPSAAEHPRAFSTRLLANLEQLLEQHPLTLDPVSFAAIERCMAHRDALGTRNPHLIVTKVTRPRLTPPSPAYMTHVLDDAGVRVKKLRATRLIELLHGLDAKLVAEALGMNGDGLLGYLADDVETGRLDESNL